MHDPSPIGLPDEMDVPDRSDDFIPAGLASLGVEADETELAMMEPSRAQSAASDGPGGAARGARLFAHNCQACHGEGAVGGTGPKLAGTTILKNEEVFSETVAHGRGLMPAWGTVLSHQEIADIHAWLVSR